ncbi:ABC transporter ATP-binding protein [Rhizobium sp. LjRoot30]|uniref:ABC transporter ATP-binding protein n=1 Tax=Rhizobium sp. LjRoot30 TaxID=3342320 RepID=UPI003ECCD9F8
MTDENPVVLELRGITKRFGPLVANEAIDLVMRKGEILALLGENGAGKTTLMNILFGHYVADEGGVFVADGAGALQPLPPGSPRAALDAGIGMVHQHFALAENLTVIDNITLGTEPLFRFSRANAAARAKLAGLMERSGLKIDLDAQVSQLSVGERQRIEILKALYRDARILVLDEPTAVLTPQESDGLFETLRSLAAHGLSVVFISHKLHEVVSGSDRVAVLRGGRKVAEIPTRGSDKAQLAELMVGRAVSRSKREPRAPGAPVLILADVSVGGANIRQRLENVSLTVREGEILGIAGVSGNGQTALANLLSGLVTPSSGTLSLGGKVLSLFDPQKIVAAGVGRIPEDRHHEGAVGSMTIAENIALETIRNPRFQRFGFLKFGAIRARAEEAIKAYDIRCPGPDAAIRQLSGGNMQKAILARALDDEPRLILANQPTRGLDVGAVAEVHRRLLLARERGAAIVLITEDLDELFELSDRIAVMFRSRLTESFASADLDLKTLGLMMAGHDTNEAA